MSKNVLNKTLLSMATASLLTTTAFASVTLGSDTKSENSSKALSKNGGELGIFKVYLDNSDLKAKLTDLNLTIKSDEANLSFLESFKIYVGSKAEGAVFTHSLKDTNLSKDIIIDLSKNTDPKFEFVNQGSSLTTYIITLDYGKIEGIENKELNISLYNLHIIERTERTDDNGTKIQVNSDPINIPVDKNVTKLAIDTIAPKFGDSNSSGTTFATGLDAVSKDDNLANGFSVDINFTEMLSFDDTNLTTSINNTNLNNAFTIQDSNGNEINITSATYTDPKLTLVLNSNIIGDVTLAYTSGLLKDSAKNLVADLTARQIFDDVTPVTLEKIDVDFETSKKGQVTFSEPIKTDSLNTLNVFGKDNTDSNNTIKVSNLTVVPQEDKNAKTILSFETNVTIGNDFTLIFGTVESGNTPLTDLGNNENNGTEPLRFTAGQIGTKIEANKWNLISIPSGTRTTSKKITATGSVQTIWGYDSTKSEDNRWEKSPIVLDAGKGYWIKGSVNTTDFHITETTGFNAVKEINSKTIINKNSTAEWSLLGTEAELTWADAYKQVHENCSTVSIYAYHTVTNSWNSEANISANSGIWVKQENCKK